MVTRTDEHWPTANRITAWLGRTAQRWVLTQTERLWPSLKRNACQVTGGENFLSSRCRTA